MLEPRWRKVWRDAALHKARTSVVLLAIAVGIAGAGSILNAWALVRRVTHESYLASDPAAATLRVDSVNDRVLQLARGVPGVRDAQARRAVVAAIRAGAGWQTALLFSTTDFRAYRIGRIHPEAGAWPPADGDVVIERSSVEFSGARVGEPVSIAVGGADARPLNVSGIVREVGLAPGWMEHAVYGFVTPATLAKLGAPSSLDQLQVVVTDREATQEEVRRVAYRVKNVLEASGLRVSDVDVPVPGEHIHAAQMDSLLFTQGAFALLALVVCGFLVVNLIAAMLAGQAREIGVMKTLGATSAQLGAMYLIFAGGIGLAASALAIPAALRIGRSYGALKGELLNFDVAGYSIPWWAVALQVVVATLLPVLAAAVPVRRACRASVASALREVGLDRAGGDATVDRWSARLGGISRPTLLAIRNAFRNRQRMTLTLLALAGGGAVFLGAANLRASVIHSLDLLFEQQRYSFSVRLGEPHAADSVERVVAGVTGVTSVEAWSGVRASVARDSDTQGNAFAITAPPATTKLVAPRMVAGRWLSPGDGREIVVSQSLLKREPSLRLGASVPLMIDGRETRWVVIGIADAGPVPSAYAAREALAQPKGMDRVSTAVVATDAKGIAAQVELIQRVRSALGDTGMQAASSQLLEESRRVMEDHLLMVVQFLAVMGWVMIAVGGMGLMSTMSLAVLERTREIGVLRAIGARHRSVLLLIQTEGLVIAVCSWLVALPLSAPMSVALARAFSRVMLEVPGRWLPEKTGVAEWLVISIGLSVIACAWPALRAMRTTVARALAYE
jgi:putative ABC transport system permease protein